MRRFTNQINDLRDAVLPLLGAGRDRPRPTGRSFPPPRVSVSMCCEISHFPAKRPLRSRQSADRASAVDVVDAVEKAQKASPPRHSHRESSASLQLKLGLPPKNWFVARDSPVTLEILYSARPYTGSNRSAENTMGAFAITQIVGKSGENLRLRITWFVDDLPSIRSRTPRCNSEFLAKIQRL